MLGVLLLLLCFSIAQALPTIERNALKDLAQALKLSEWDFNSESGPCGNGQVVCNNGSVTEILLHNEKKPGYIPTSIGSLSALTTLQLYDNYLTGTIPASIGQLILLEKLHLGTNFLSGSIPPQIGSLSKLVSLQLDNNKLNGTIPSSIANLTSLNELLLPTNSLNGSIPPEFGRLTKLTKLWLHSNRLSGPLPQSFANLTNIENLTLSYNSFSGNISFIQSMPMLKHLRLNRNNFSGSIPNVSFANLTECDLGFNQLEGTIPASFASSKLEIFFVGHNRLQGSIPLAFRNLSSLSRLDVSHNSLTGLTSHVDYVYGKDLSFNYFEDQELNCRAYSTKQIQDVCFPSTEGSRRGFRINAGGEKISVNGEFFEADSTEVSTGLNHIGNTDCVLQISGLEGNPNTDNPDSSRGGNVKLDTRDGVYATAKWSSSYLAYHGTRLAKGTYSVTLYFADTTFASKNNRVFDVFIQRKLVLQDFDIKATNGTSAFSRSFNASVTNGTLSIELIGSRYNYYYTIGSGPIISAISVTSVNSSIKKKSSKWILIGATIGGLVLLLLLVFAASLFLIRKRGSSRYSSYDEGALTTNTMDNISKIGPTIYTYQELREATGDFDEKLLLGKGGFGAVYKGTLPNGSVVAVKQLTRKSSKDAKIFKKEIAILSMLQHRNLVGINGYCLESENSLLVCDYMENGSLEKALFKGPGLDWETRMKIAIGAACGLQYLHEESKYHVIHCDVKPANILLDTDMHACVADFGLAKLFKDKITKTVENKVGTCGYMAPEYIRWNELSEKVDVYSFGVVLLELLSGKHATKQVSKSWEESGESSTSAIQQALELAYPDPSRLLDLIDAKLDDKFDKQEALHMSILALLCTQDDPKSRPTMREVWLMLNKTIETPLLPSQFKMPRKVPKENISGYYTSLDGR